MKLMFLQSTYSNCNFTSVCWSSCQSSYKITWSQSLVSINTVDFDTSEQHRVVRAIYLVHRLSRSRSIYGFQHKEISKDSQCSCQNEGLCWLILSFCQVLTTDGSNRSSCLLSLRKNHSNIFKRAFLIEI